MKSKILTACLLTAVSILVEIFLFNIRSFELVGCRSPMQSKSFTANEISLSQNSDNSQTTIVISGKADIPNDLRNIHIEFEKPYTHIIHGHIATTEPGFRWGHEKDFEIVPGVSHSSHFFLYKSKRVTEVRITLDNVEAQPITIHFNQPVPIEINLLRLVMIFSVLMLLTMLRPGSALYQIPFDIHQPKQKAALAVIFMCQCIFLIFSTFSTYPDFSAVMKGGNIRKEPFVNTQHYQLLTEAMAAGSVSLLEEPPAALEKLLNPYDKQEREKNVPDTIWDAVYYEGKYYIYFGVTPVITFFLPFYWLSGEYIFFDLAVLIYAIIGSAGLLYCFSWIAQRFFSKIPAALVMISAVILLNSSGLVFCTRCPLTYEIALASAFCFAVVGLAFNLSAVSNSSHIRRWKLLIGCLLMALAVGCRPTAILISLLNLPFILPRLINGWKERKLHVDLPAILCAAIPYIVVGAGLMFYNYLRFHSPFEFGRNYQFSFIDATAYANGLAIPNFLLGVVNFFFGSGFQLLSEFPFVEPTAAIKFGFAGFREFEPTFPLLAFCPLAVLVFFTPWLNKHLRAKGTDFCVFFWLSLIIGIFLAGFSGSAAGIIQRYMVDFYWLLCLCGLLLAFIVYEMLDEKQVGFIIQGAFLLCLFASVLFCNSLSCGEISSDNINWFLRNNPILFKTIAFAFEFWL